MKQGPRPLKVVRMRRASRFCSLGSRLRDWLTNTRASVPSCQSTTSSRLIRIQGRSSSQRRSALGS